jgi:hypothetical protein
MSTVNPVQTTTYTLSTSNNPIYFGSFTYINVAGDNGVYGGFLVHWNVTNAGSITGSGFRKAGIFLDGGYPSTVANLATGVISGSTFGVYNFGDGTVTNAGSISASSDVGVDDNGALSLINQKGGSIYGLQEGVGANGGGTVTNARGATISSPGFGVYLYARSGETSTVTNAGTISGSDSVYFKGAGVQSLILKTGSRLNGTAVGSTASGATNALVLKGHGTARNVFENFNTLTAKTNANWTLERNSVFGAEAIASGASVDFRHGTTIGGRVSGAGTLEFGGGDATIDSGAKISVANWTVSGSGTSVTLDEQLTYGGAFTGSAGATLDLSGGNLTLDGMDAFTGVATSGSHTLRAEGTTTVSGLTIGGTTTFHDANLVTESGGSATVGDAAGDVAKLIIGLTGAWDIVDDSGIGLGASPSSSISNSGVFEKTGGDGASSIAPKLINNGAVDVSNGTLDFERAVSGTGTDTIVGGSTLEFDSVVSSSKTVGAQNVDFSGGGTLDLTDPKAFWGEISGFAQPDTIDLFGNWAFSGISDVAGVTTLTLASGATTHAFTFVGDYAQTDFSIASGATTTITHT